MASEEERARIMAEYLAGADEDDGLGDFDPDDVRGTCMLSLSTIEYAASIGHFTWGLCR